MRRRTMWILAAVALLVPSVANAQPCESEARVSAAKAAIAQTWARYETARNQRDLGAWLALWDDDGVKLPPDGSWLLYRDIDNHTPFQD